MNGRSLLRCFVRRLALAVAIAVTSMSCGGGSTPTPTTPTPPAPADVRGSWTGNIQFTQNAGVASLSVEVALTQSGSTVSGTWASGTAGWEGTITGGVDTSSFTGSYTFSLPAAGTGRCTGTGSLSGGAGGATLRWTSPGFTGACSNLPVSVTWNLQRR